MERARPSRSVLVGESRHVRACPRRNSALISFGQTVLTVTRTAASTVTANTLVEESGTTGNIVTATDGRCTGVALNTGTAVQVVEYGTAAVLLGTTSAIVGDLVTCPSSGTTGYGVDSGVTSVAGVDLGVQIIGRIISAAAPGASTTLATVQLFGPGVAGTGWVPLVLGFGQFTNSSTGSGSYTDAYTYKMCAPFTGPLANPCPTPFVPTTGTASSYAGWWIDRGGFGSSGFGTTAVAPYDYELLRLSAVTQAATRENTLEIFDFTAPGSLGSVPASFFNEAGTKGLNPPMTEIKMYGINTHTSGCAGVKCTGSAMDYDIQQIGIESDVEERSGTGKLSSPSVGVYSVCANCNNSASVGTNAGPNVAFLADSNVAIGSGGTTTPWGVGFQTNAGAALTGLLLGPKATTGPSNAQPLVQCAYINSAPATGCTTIATTSSSITNISSPGRSQFLNTSGSALSAVGFSYNQNTYTSSTTYAMGATDLGAYWNNNGAMGTVTLTLPAPSAGAAVYFNGLANATFNIYAPSGSSFCKQATCTPAGHISSTTSGTFAKVYSTGTNWYVEYETGFTGP